MSPEIEIEAAGRKVCLRLDIGAWRDIAKVQPVFRELATALATGIERFDEVEALFTAALKAGGSGLTFDEFWEAMPLNDLVKHGQRLLHIAFTGLEPDKDKSAGERMTAPSSPGST